MIKKGSWVQIKKIILQPRERAENIPEATKKVPLLMWVKGHLQTDANLHDMVEIKTITGRTEVGELIQENPSYLHTYGNYIPEIQKIDQICKETLYGSDING